MASSFLFGSFLFVLRNFIARQPHDFVFPLFRLEERMFHTFPQSHRHFHVTSFLPDFVGVSATRSKTTSFPNRFPVKSTNDGCGIIAYLNEK